MNEPQLRIGDIMSAYFSVSFTRVLVFLALLLPVLLFVVPSWWPEPAVSVSLAEEIAGGYDLPFTLKVRTWHENFNVRLVQVVPSDASSTAGVGRNPFLPMTVLRQNLEEPWSIGLFKRVAFPRTLTLNLSAPIGILYRQGKLSSGVLRGTFHVEIDHTKALSDGSYPALVYSTDIPFAVQIRN